MKLCMGIRSDGSAATQRSLRREVEARLLLIDVLLDRLEQAVLAERAPDPRCQGASVINVSYTDPLGRIQTVAVPACTDRWLPLGVTTEPTARRIGEIFAAGLEARRPT